MSQSPAPKALKAQKDLQDPKENPAHKASAVQPDPKAPPVNAAPEVLRVQKDLKGLKENPASAARKGCPVKTGQMGLRALPDWTELTASAARRACAD